MDFEGEYSELGTYTSIPGVPTAQSLPSLDVVSGWGDFSPSFSPSGPSQGVIDQALDESGPDGWDAFSHYDLNRVLFGSEKDGLTGYLHYNRRINLKKTLGMPVPNKSYPIDISPCEFLETYQKKKLAHYSDQSLVLHSEETGFVQKKMLTRGMAAYDAKVGDNFDDLEDYIIAKDLPSVFLTLSPRTPEGTSPLDTLLAMKPIVNRLMSFLQRKLGHRPEYVWICESTKRGHAHYHLLFIGLDWLISKEVLDGWWKAQGLGDEHGVYINAIKDPKKASGMVIRYMLAYLLKPDKNDKWAGLLGLTGKRSWGMSNSLRAKIKAWKTATEGSSEGTPEGASEGTPEGASRLACIGLTNSNKSAGYQSIGVLTKLECEIFLSDPTRQPTPEGLLQDLREIRGVVHSINSGKSNLPGPFRRR